METEKRTVATFAEPTEEQIANSDVIATVFIKVRIEQLKAMRAECACRFSGHGLNCNECIGRGFAVRELENIL